MKKFILFAITFFILTSCTMKNSENLWSDWSMEVNGLQMRARPTELALEVEIKNVSTKDISLFDFQDKPQGWMASASYFRGMLIGYKNLSEPSDYHLLSSEITKITIISPGESYFFVQNAPPASEKLQLIYDTKIAERWWPGEYWKGRLETPIIP